MNNTEMMNALWVNIPADEFNGVVEHYIEKGMITVAIVLTLWTKGIAVHPDVVDNAADELRAHDSA